MMGGGIRSWGWLILKFSNDRSVCAPQYLSAGTWTSPKASVSALVSAIVFAVAWKNRVWMEAFDRLFEVEEDVEDKEALDLLYIE